ncbi:MAG: Helix-turn-helix domain protein [Firmicutes bacterium ADurb.Bin373]|nr:MAG: Helix-turn-helix domain protein [Firmicutes bacterium ADurb.Bin373]
MPKEIMGNKVFTVEETAKLFNVTRRTIQSYIKDGKIKGQKIGGMWYFTEETLQAFVRGEQPRGERA